MPEPSPVRASASHRLQPLRHVDAGVLNIAYYEAGPADGPAVMLLHGFPYDIHSFVDVAPLLAAQGCRTIVPYLRGYGPTRFRDQRTPRSGEQAAVGADLMALMDALSVQRAVFAGYDWGWTPRDFNNILKLARDLFPDAADYDRGEYRACLRPMTPDGPPILGLGRHRNLFFNSGHGHMGWTMACGTARIVADLMGGRMPALDLEGLTLRR